MPPSFQWLTAALVVTVFLVSGVLHMVTITRCDANQLASLLKRDPCDRTVRALLGLAGVGELIASIVIIMSFTKVLSSRPEFYRRAALTYLMAFTALVTMLFKVPRLFSRKQTSLTARLIPLSSNITTFGGLLSLF